MITVKILKGQEAKVLEVLQEVEAARSSDYILFNEIIKRFYPDVAKMPFCEGLMYAPSYESITRVRRKIQSEHPELESERAKQRRKKQELEFRAYAEV